MQQQNLFIQSEWQVCEIRFASLQQQTARKLSSQCQQERAPNRVCREKQWRHKKINNLFTYSVDISS